MRQMFFAMSLSRLFLAAQPVLSDICVQQGVAYQRREGRIGLLRKADRYLISPERTAKSCLAPA